MATYDLTSVSMPTTLEMGDILNCPYTGDKVSITLPAGRYCLECWGAQGGYRSSTDCGGKGGYSNGVLTLEEATEVFLYAGGKGGTNSSFSNSVVSGGFNGGGYRYGYCGGGGASDIRIGTDSLYARVIVAGGGGSDGHAGIGGGAGGGTSGQTKPTSGYGTGGLGGQSTYSGSSTSTTATTQATSGLDASTISLTYGGFGFGGAGLYVGSGYGGAGGGGWYGGQGTMPDDSNDDDKSGGGGSGFVYTKDTVRSVPIGYLLSGQYYLTQAETKQGTISFISPNNTTETGHSGDGYVRITVGEVINDPRRRKSARIQQKGNSSTEWDPDVILLSREIGIETDTNKMKIGDGITPWSSLPYFNSSTSASDEEIKRIKYYGDPDIIPSDKSYFTVNETGETIIGLTDTGKTQTELVIPYEIDGVRITKIGESAFKECENLETVKIPNGIIHIGKYAFKWCRSLTLINIPNGVTSIEEQTFESCGSLISINIPNTITSIGSIAFAGCGSLTSITIPNGVTSIGSSAFEQCTTLTSINIPNSVTSIGAAAFAHCTSLTSISIPNGVINIGENAFHVYDTASDSFIPIPGLTIYCEQGSYAETYANTNNISVTYTDIKDDALVGKKTAEGGEIFNDYENNIASGYASHAEGDNTEASGVRSHAEGYDTTASANCSHAEGAFTVASGKYSHAEGNSSSASGEYSHAEGSGKASGQYSHAEGGNTYAMGKYSHTEGSVTRALGDNSHAGGANTKAISNSSVAMGNNSIAGIKGYYYDIIDATSLRVYKDQERTTEAQVPSSWLNGRISLVNDKKYDNITQISSIDADGSTIRVNPSLPFSSMVVIQTPQFDDYSIICLDAPLDGEIDFGVNAVAMGENNKSLNKDSFVTGMNNEVIGQYSFGVGRDNTVGYAGFASGRSNTANVYGHAEGNQVIASGETAHAEGKLTVASAFSAHAEGYDTEATARAAHSEGELTKATGMRAHAEGYKTKSSGEESHSEGSETTASGKYAHSEGNKTIASGESAHSEGAWTVAKGLYSHAEGKTSVSNGLGSHAEGCDTVANGKGAHSEGLYTKAGSDFQHVQGKYNIVDSSNVYADIVGNGTSNTARSNAYTLDWSGNAWFASTVTAGRNTTDDDNDLVLVTKGYLKSYVETAINNYFVNIRIAEESEF